ncbi:MAG: 50S ribosomal protein L15 [Treponema sp.]|nr:50S ribosomal protein L15 [Treponema sp.]
MAHSFDLHAPDGANKKKRILGRGQGSGRGTTAGKGNKGQKARSGGKTYIGFEGGQMPVYRRLARRGFSNHPFKKEWQIVNLDKIEKRFEATETVEKSSLIKKGLIKKTLPVKILANGKFTKQLNFKVNAVSDSAKAKIENAGGSISIISPAKKIKPKKGKNNG